MSEIVEHLYIVQNGQARKLWIVHNWWRRFPPRLKQIANGFLCVVGHEWSDWQVDDEDGPTEVVGYDIEGVIHAPLCTRKSRPNEEGIRVCHRCSTVQRRWPLDSLSLDFGSIWPKGDLVSMAD